MLVAAAPFFFFSDTLVVFLQMTINSTTAVTITLQQKYTIEMWSEQMQEHEGYCSAYTKNAHGG
jgi:hypothetical protein